MDRFHKENCYYFVKDIPSEILKDYFHNWMSHNRPNMYHSFPNILIYYRQYYDMYFSVLYHKPILTMLLLLIDMSKANF